MLRPVFLDTIPQELIQKPNWVGWIAVKKPGKKKLDKPPKIAGTSTGADSTDPSAWRSFDKAKAAYLRGKHSGIGFCLKDSGLVGVDVDEARDPVTREIKPWVLRLIHRIASYVEWSPGGDGVHILARGKLPQAIKHEREFADGAKVEIYDTKRYFTVTGDVWEGFSEITDYDFTSFWQDLADVPVKERPAKKKKTEADNTIAQEKPADAATPEKRRSHKIRRQDSFSSFNLGKWLRFYCISILTEKWEGGQVTYEYPCAGTHGGYPKDDGKAFVIQFANGGISCGCQHSTCSFYKELGNHWPTLRGMYEPRYRAWNDSTNPSADAVPNESATSPVSPEAIPQLVSTEQSKEDPENSGRRDSSVQQNEDQASRVKLPVVNPLHDHDDHEIADELVKPYSRFVAAESTLLEIAAIWTLHTHAFPAFTFTPYFVATSAEKGSGKSTLLSVHKTLARSPLKTASISAAALARGVEEDRPTVLLDEYDIQLNPKLNEDAGLLRGILNDGFHIDGSYTRMVGNGTNMHRHTFSTFCPKALAGIGQLDDTIASRSLIERLKRVSQGEVEPFRPYGMSLAAKKLHEELEALRLRAAKWGSRHLEQIANFNPVCPANFTSRQRDVSEPLIMICGILGGEWPDRIEKALKELFAAPAAEDTSQKVRLLGHIRKLFLDKYDVKEDCTEPDKKQLRTKDLLAALHAIEDAPWARWDRGNGLDGNGLSRLLRDFDIRSQSIRDPETCRGYKLADFLDSFGRYLPPVCTCKDCKCHEVCSGTCSTPCSTPQGEN
jgi:hypothetical protein